MSRFFSSSVRINSAMNTVKIILLLGLLGLLPLSFTSLIDEAIGHLCHPDPTKIDEFPGVIRFPIPHDSDSIPSEFRALVGTEFARPEDHLYPTVRFCRVSILVINRTSPFWPFQDLPVHNEVHQFQGYPYISAEQLFDNSFPQIQSVQLETINYHFVGGWKGWTMNLNSVGWAADEQFMVGDDLIFAYDINHYDVLEVSRSGYDNCDDKYLLMNVTTDAWSAFKLTEAKPYYFISSRDHCLQGLKLAIDVHEYTSSTAATD